MNNFENPITQIEKEPRVLDFKRFEDMLTPALGLFGTCGDSSWRSEYFIPKLKAKGLAFFNPQVEEWDPSLAAEEVKHLSRDKVIALPISKETEGYASLAESGWAILSAILRGQKIGVYIEEDEEMGEEAKRARMLVRKLAEKIAGDYPVFSFEESFEDLSSWTIFQLIEFDRLKKSLIKETRTVELPNVEGELKENVGIYGTSAGNPVWRKQLMEKLDDAGVDFFDSYKEDWNEADAEIEAEHKISDKVIVQVISADSESYGALAESGWMALSAFMKGQKLILMIEDHESDAKSSTNRARTLVRGHIGKLNEDFPGLVTIVDSIDKVAEEVIKATK